MNLQQLEYILALEEQQHFGRAAEACFVTQPTLSMMVKRLEDELGVEIFDRNSKPIVPTEAGQTVLSQARRILQERDKLHDLLSNQKEAMSGELRVGIIPTLGPYLAPLFIDDFLKEYPQVELFIFEMITDEIIDGLSNGKLDVGILVTPLHQKELQEHVVFNEAFLAYSAEGFGKEYILPEDIDPNQLLLLEEGHCFRSQIINLCELRRNVQSRLQFRTGSIETLRRMVEHRQGVTVLPELATLDMPPSERKRLTPFKEPAPVREVSLVTHHTFVRSKLLQAMKEQIIKSLPKGIRQRKAFERVEI